MKIIKSDAYPRKINRFRLISRFYASAKSASHGASNADAIAVSNKDEAGFTLAEIMVACAMLALMVVSLYGGVSFGFTSITIARQNLRATQIALEKMEITRMYSWEQVNSNGFIPTTFTAPFYPSTSGGNTNGGLLYYGTMAITPVTTVDPSYGGDMRELRVTLTWTNRNIPQSLQMNTYISQYGMQRYIY